MWNGAAKEDLSWTWLFPLVYTWTCSYNKIIIVNYIWVHGIHLIKLRGDVAPRVGDHVPPLGVLRPGHDADDPGHEAVQCVVVTTDHRGGAGQTRGELGTGV